MTHAPTNGDAAPPPDSDYLWDRSGPVDPHIAELEQTLQPLRYDGDAPVGVVAARRRRRPALAAAAIIGGAAAVGLFMTALDRPATWNVTVTRGTPTIDKVTVTAPTSLQINQWLETEADDVATLSVADIGELVVSPRTRLRLVENDRQNAYRVELRQGVIHADILAPPRLFLVDTPSAQAVDLGCTYRLAVDESGTGLLEVDWGWVALESDGSSSSVPAGAACRLRAGRGPGLPWFKSANRALLSGAAAFDRDEENQHAVAEILRTAQTRDLLTLHHLLERTRGRMRTAVLDRMLMLSDLPQGVSRERILALDDDALLAWWLVISKEW